MGKSQPAKAIDVVDDFLYIDRTRLAGYHTQLLGSGTPLQSKLLDNYKKSEESVGKIGIPAILGEHYSVKDENSGGKEFTFDLAWLTALQTLDELGERGYITDKVVGTSVGSMMRLRGALQIIDTSVVPHIWNILREELTASHDLTDTQRAVLNELVQKNEQPLAAQFITSETPPGEPMVFGENSATAWGILDPKNLIGSHSTLMNGGFFTGEYEMVAILDAGSGPAPDLSSLEVTNMITTMLMLQQLMRGLFGRPDYANGVTPLVISRKLVKEAL